MKSTGVIRRIDDLGRLVIPKEIRKNLRIKEGENLEIFISDDDIILKKYSQIKRINDYAQNITNAIYDITKKTIFITDGDLIVAITGNKKYLNKEISEQLQAKIKRRENILEKYQKDLQIITDETIETCYALCPIILNGDSVGVVGIINEEVEDIDFKMVKIAAKIIESYLDNV